MIVHRETAALLLRRSVLLALPLFLAACFGGSQPASDTSPQQAAPVPAATARPQPSTLPSPQPIQLPRDDGPHSVLTEWWYYSGHLQSSNGEQYGFLAVIFKRQGQPDRAGYVGHVAITDPQRRVFQFKEAVTIASETRDAGPAFRLQAGSVMLAGGSGQDRIEGSTDSYRIQLALDATKPPVEQGEKGYISVSPNEYSYYYSRTRMNAQGTISRQGVPVAVSGLAWMDHQWGDFSLQGDGGWDWFGLQLDDGTDLMLSVIRNGEGSRLLSYGSLIDEAGKKQHLDEKSLQVQSTGSWKSPHTGGTYPQGWKITLPNQRLDITVLPVLSDQEMVTLASVGRAYWEGLVTVTGEYAGRPIKGKGYVELTGYAPQPGNSGKP